MKKDWKYILYLSLVVGVFVFVKLIRPKEYSWNISLAHESKDPYGTYALAELLPSLLRQSKIENSYKTIYELKDSLLRQESIFILATRFDAGKEDVNVLLSQVENGATIFISANSFFGKLADTLSLATNDNLFSQSNVFDRKDTTSLHFVNPTQDTTQLFYYSRDNVHHYFGKLDSAKASVIAKNDFNQPVTLNIPRGKGHLILNCTPMAFTNIHLLSKENVRFAAGTFSYLPDRKVYRTEYYHVGRMEAGTPLRFILSNEPLSWAYYILMVSILLFMMFESKRKQRIIPIIKPFSNTTLEFIATVGNLYYQSSDHKNIAEKKIQYFSDQVRNRYYVNINIRGQEISTALAGKSGHSIESVTHLLGEIDRIMAAPKISKEDLTTLNNELEKFWRQS